MQEQPPEPKKLEVCGECGAVDHGNMFCNGCRTVWNARHGWNLPPWEGPPVKPCDVEDLMAFARKLGITLDAPEVSS